MDATPDREPAPQSDSLQAMQQFAVRWTDAQPLVAAMIATLVPDHHDAEDLLQRTAATLVQRFSTYDEGRPFVAWAIGYARIEVLRYRQERSRNRLMLDPEAIDRIIDAFGQSEAEAREIRGVIEGCVAKLRGRVRQVLEQHYTHQRSAAEIARHLKTSANAVTIALSRGRAAVRRCVERTAGLEELVS